MQRTLDARKVAAGAALTIALGVLGVGLGGPAVLAWTHLGPTPAITGVAPAAAVAAELTADAFLAPSAALPALLLPSAPLTLAEARARWLASDAARRVTDASDAWARHPEP